MNFDFEKLKQLFFYNEDVPLLFNTGLFLFLFLAFILVYIGLRRKDTFRIVYVTLFSYYFYYKCSEYYFIALFAVTMWDFVLAYQMSKSRDQLTRKALLVMSLIANLGLLSYFKYTNLFYQLYTDLVNEPFNPLNIVLPAGISFFTFQSMSYTIDVYRNQLKPLNSFLDYAFYISFFPPLVAGPIVRAKDFIPQIKRPLFISKEMFGVGVFFVITGLFKKAVISDYISANFVDRIFENPSLYTGVENLFGVYGYALQIYCDFSGYSDMAIGLALLLGFKFNLNFDSPYQSATITEFWRRWHISLSSWLKDYLYISLGGNRKGKIRTYLNLFITMLLGGLWHGASLRFICWGAIHGIALAIHKLVMTFYPQLKPSGDKMKKSYRILGIVFTFHLVCFSWIFFRADSFSSALEVIRQIFSATNFYVFPEMIKGYPMVFGLMLIGFTLHFMPSSWEQRAKYVVVDMNVFAKALLVIAVIVLIMQIKSSEIQPFIYFQF